MIPLTTTKFFQGPNAKDILKNSKNKFHSDFFFNPLSFFVIDSILSLLSAKVKMKSTKTQTRTPKWKI